MRYYLPDLGGTADTAREFPYGDEHDRSSAEEAACDFHDRHCGWECGWPLVLVLVDDEGKESRWNVDRRMEPVFDASEVKEK
jgi:hypothetical protein